MLPDEEAIISRLESELSAQLGVSNRDLAEYIVSIGRDGPQAVRQELKELPDSLVQSVLEIIAPKKPGDLKLLSVHAAEVTNLKQFGAFVRLVDPSPIAGREGLIPTSRLEGRLLRRGERINVRLINVNGNKLTFAPDQGAEAGSGSLDAQPQGGAHKRAFEASRPDPALLGAPSEDSFASAGPAVVVKKRKPAFLSAEAKGYSGKAAPVAVPRRHQWLDKAVQHTSEKMLERGPGNKEVYAAPSGLAAKAGKNSSSTRREGYEASTAPTELPIHGFKSEILDAVAENPVIVVVGDTGSGKTTQITQFLHSAGYSQNNKIIGCTQPRRIAAISIAQRVAREMHAGKVGEAVGYAVRFDDATSKETEVKYMTDGLLLNELVSDPNASQYSAIMLDEAHERTIATDVLFALLKSAVARRPDLRLIVTSATLDAHRFAEYFGGAPILRIPGRTYPVTIKWAEEPILDYMEAAISAVKEIHQAHKSEPGDILLFLTGQSEIDLASSLIAKSYPKGDLIPVPVYAALPSDMQAHIFFPAPEGKRKVVIATNIAETSLTIDGILYVVDPGFAKVKAWDARQAMGVLKVEPISQAQANQRSGRAGRTAPGTCYRLYTEESFNNEMPRGTVPEIQRENMAHMALMLKSMGIKDLVNFDFMDPPPADVLLKSLEELYLLGALDDNGDVTPLGYQMAKFPLDPSLTKVLQTSFEFGTRCTEDILSIIAMVSMPSVLYRPSHPPAKRLEAERSHRQLQDPIWGDHLTLLNIYNRWKQSSYSKKWCDNNYVQYRTLLKVRDARHQLSNLVTKAFPTSRLEHDRETLSTKQMKENVIKVLCSGFFRNIAMEERNHYVTLEEGTKVDIHPSSALFRKSPAYVLYNSLILTSKEYMHVVSRVRPEWLSEMVPNFFKEADEEDSKKHRKLQKLSSSQESRWHFDPRRATVPTQRRY